MAKPTTKQAISAKLFIDDLAQLRALAKERGVSFASLLDEAIKQYLEGA